MIKRLKLRFIILSMTTLLILLAVIVTGMNVISYNAVTAEADEVVELLSHNKGKFPPPLPHGEHSMPEHMSPEIPYESRYFWVLLDGYGNVIQAETSKIASISTADAIDFAKNIYNKNKATGCIKTYRYRVFNESEGTRITFLDCSNDLKSFRSFTIASIVMSIAGYIIVFFVIFFVSGKILRPIAESYDKQKLFITDAGHEIKTPLTIINANADVLEMDTGKNECISDIKQQTKRLAALTNDLIYLARMEEIGPTKMSDTDLSSIISHTVDSFKALARTKNIEFYCNIQPSIHIKGERKALVQLITILIDNAIKYSPSGGILSLDFRRDGKTAKLHIVNSTEQKLERRELEYVFDRFYRTDRSRNTETGGYGIGLSVAKAIVASHKGKIEAWTPDEKSFHITSVFPSV